MLHTQSRDANDLSGAQLVEGWESRLVADEIYWNDHAFISSAFASAGTFRTVLEILKAE